MSLKINCLIISTVVLTVLVKMVPAPYDENLYDLHTLQGIYKTEILHFCEKNQIQTNDGDMSAATKLYVKDVLNNYNRYNRHLIFESNTLIKFLILMNDIQHEELKEEIEIFKQHTAEVERELYETATFCNLPKEIEESYFLEKLRIFYSYYNTNHSGAKPLSAKEILNKYNKSRIDDGNESMIDDDPFSKDSKFYLTRTTYARFIPLYIEELHAYNQIAFPENKLPFNFLNTINDIFDDEGSEGSVDLNRNDDDDIYNDANNPELVASNYIYYNYKRFTQIWNYYAFDENVFYNYLILDKNVIEDHKYKVELPKFLQIFKESLDNCYQILIGLKITTLTDIQQNVYYKQMLKALKNIYDAYNYDANNTREILAKFVKRMIDVAELINNAANNTKKKELIEDKIYKCDDLACDLPYNVNFKDILNYLINRKLNQ